ncbi:MAG: sensor protein [Gemmatimonadetes bacterium]|nr:sensor protein [Gemmatimonadota bacterium]
MPQLHRDAHVVPHAEAWALLDVIPDGVLVLDGEWRCRYANDALETIVGRTSAELLGHRVWDVLATPAETDFMARLRRAATEQQSDIIEWAGPEGEGVMVQVQPRPNWTTLLLRRESAPVSRSCAIDEQTESRFLHAQRLEVVGRIVGGVAHDFNNLLTVIQSYCGFVSAELPAGSAVHVDMDEVMHAANSAADLTRQLLAFSRRHVNQPRPLDVRHTAARIVGMLRRVLGEDIYIETDFAPTTCAVVADPGQLEQALMNLAVNARDAMPDGGTLRLRTSTLALDAATSGPRLRPGTYASIVVEDTGSGIHPDVIGKIFDAFYTTKEEGTGLGLAMVLGIVERIGGDVRVESEVGRGSRFTVLLPCLNHGDDDEATRDNTGTMSETPLPRGTETILVVEDELSVRVAIRRMLERLGYIVMEAATGAEALSIAAALSKPPDLVLTDVIMPGESGRVVADRLLQRWPTIKVLFMTGYTEEALRRRGIVVAVEALLEKPLSVELVGRAVRRSLDGARLA